MNHPFENADVISSYTRKQAIEDGVLVDISEISIEAGIRYPVAVTQGVFAILDDTSCPGQDFQGRTWDMLMIFRLDARSANSDEIHFAPLFVMPGIRNAVSVEMWAKCGPGDDGEPVVTIMMPDED